MKEQFNSNFCYAPWLSLHIWPNGNVFPCCVWDNKDPIGNINNNDLKEIYNSEKIKEVRVKMLNNKTIPSCTRCTNIESFSPDSYRIRINRDFKDFKPFVDQTNNDGSIKDIKIKLWDFRLSNFCNLKCRSCGHSLSSSWFKDSSILYNTPQQKALITVNDKVSFMDMIEEQYEHVEEIYFAGGEPLMMPEHYTILDKLIEKGNTNVRLRYSTNLTKLTYKGKHIFDYWKHFPYLEVLVSLDGVGKKGEYIRKGLNYPQLEKNLNELKNSNLNFTQVGFMVTYGVLNYEHLFDMVLEFLDKGFINKAFTKDKKNNFVVHFSPIFDPQYYNCQFLPSIFKKRFLKKLDNFPFELKKRGVDEYVIHDIISKLQRVYSNSLKDEFNPEIMQKFIEITKKLDNIREEGFNSIFPEYSLEKDFKPKSKLI